MSAGYSGTPLARKLGIKPGHVVGTFHAPDLEGGQVRTVGLEKGLVDNKVCAIDGDWSGLRFVYRLKDR